MPDNPDRTPHSGSADHYADAMAQALQGPTTADLAYERGFREALAQAASVAKHMGRAASKGVTRTFAGPDDQGEQTAAAILKMEVSYAE